MRQMQRVSIVYGARLRGDGMLGSVVAGSGAAQRAGSKKDAGTADTRSDILIMHLQGHSAFKIGGIVVRPSKMHRRHQQSATVF